MVPVAIEVNAECYDATQAFAHRIKNIRDNIDFNFGSLKWTNEPDSENGVLIIRDKDRHDEYLRDLEEIFINMKSLMTYMDAKYKKNTGL